MSFEHGFTFLFFLFFPPLKQFFVTFLKSHQGTIKLLWKICVTLTALQKLSVQLQLYQSRCGLRLPCAIGLKLKSDYKQNALSHCPAI